MKAEGPSVIFAQENAALESVYGSQIVRRKSRRAGLESATMAHVKAVKADEAIYAFSASKSAADSVDIQGTVLLLARIGLALLGSEGRYSKRPSLRHVDAALEEIYESVLLQVNVASEVDVAVFFQGTARHI